MSCVICLKQLAGMTVRVDNPECRHHVSHLKCFRRWESAVVDEREGNRCPTCPNSSFRPLNINIIDSNNVPGYESEEEENEEEEERKDRREEGAESRSESSVEIDDGIGGQDAVEDNDDHPILEGQVLYAPAKQELPQNLAKTCPICFEIFRTTVLKHKHIDTVHEPRKYCQSCGSSFSRKDNLRRHVKRSHFMTHH